MCRLLTCLRTKAPSPVLLHRSPAFCFNQVLPSLPLTRCVSAHPLSTASCLHNLPVVTCKLFTFTFTFTSSGTEAMLIHFLCLPRTPRAYWHCAAPFHS